MIQSVLTFLVILLGCVAFAHLIRVYELARDLKGLREEDIPPRDNKMNGMLMIIFMLWLYGMYAWLVWKYTDQFLPVSASEHGVALDDLLDFNWLIVNFVFFVCNTVLFYFAYKYQNDGKRKACYFPHNNKLEMWWIIVPSIVMAVIIVWGLMVWNDTMGDAPEDAIVIEVYGRQFDWTVRYTGADNELGDAHVRHIAGANFVGMDPDDSRGKDDKIVKGEFHLPVDRDIKFVFRSQDILHGAYFPHFRAQMNCVPGMTTTFHFKTTRTTMEMRELDFVKNKYALINATRAEKGKEPTEFDFILLCNKICGASHYNMQMKIVVESEEEYRNWLGEQKTFAEAIGPDFFTNEDLEGTELAQY